MHVGRKADNNGNQIKVSVPAELRPMLNARGWSNLHVMWDMLIPEYLFLQNPADREPVTNNIAAPKYEKFPQFSPSEMADDFMSTLVDEAAYQLSLNASAVTNVSQLTSVFGAVAVEIHRDVALAHAYQFVSDEATGAVTHITAEKDKKPFALTEKYVAESAQLVPRLLTQSAVRLAQVLNLVAGLNATTPAPTNPLFVV